MLTSFTPGVYREYDDWKRLLEGASVRVQWDPERDLRGASLEYRSIQVGLSRHIIERYVNEWTVEIRDITPFVRTLHGLIASGHADRARDLLPKERVYPVPETLARKLGMV